MEKRIEGPRSNLYSANPPAIDDAELRRPAGDASAWSFQRHTKVQALTAARDSERRELAAADAFPAGNRR